MRRRLLPEPEGFRKSRNREGLSSCRTYPAIHLTAAHPTEPADFCRFWVDILMLARVRICFPPSYISHSGVSGVVGRS